VSPSIKYVLTNFEYKYRQKIISVNLKILVVEPNSLGGMSFSKKPEPMLGLLGVRPF
jgi:hypothetical protein